MVPKTFQEAVAAVIEEVSGGEPVGAGDIDAAVQYLEQQVRLLHTGIRVSPSETEGLWMGTLRGGLDGLVDLTGQEPAEALGSIGRLVVSKQLDYGSGNILAFGEFGVLVRLNDKIERIKNLRRTGKSPANESVLDSWRDICGYSLISVMLLRGWFTLPLAEAAV